MSLNVSDNLEIPYYICLLPCKLLVCDIKRREVTFFAELALFFADSVFIKTVGSGTDLY